MAMQNVTMVPKQIHHGNAIKGSQTGWVYSLPPKIPGDTIRQATQNRDDNKANNHCDDVAEIVSAAFGKYSAKKDPEQRAIGVAEDSQAHRDDPHIGMHDHEIRSNRCNNNHQNRNHTVAQRTARRLCSLVDVGLM